MGFNFSYEPDKRDVEEAKSGELDLSVFRGKPFYCWDRSKLGLDKCCFNHIVGLPLGNFDMAEKPFWDYHEKTFNQLFNDSYIDRKKRRHVRVKKATGLAFSEIGIRIAAWLPLYSNAYQNKQIAIITGPNIDLAVKLIRRIRGIFYQNLNIGLKGKETRIVINKCEIQAYPSNNLGSIRSLANPKYILLDEADFFGEKRKEDMWEVRYVTERYIGKSNPYILMVSTPNRPGFLYETMDHEDPEKSIYKLLEFNWEWGLPPHGNVFNEDIINDSKNTFTFAREYDLKYLGEIGNVFSELKIQKAIELGALYDVPNPEQAFVLSKQGFGSLTAREQALGKSEQALGISGTGLRHSGKGIPINKYAVHCVGIDPGFGSSRTAVTVGEWISDYGILRIVFHDEYERSNPETIADMVFSFNRIYGNCWYYVDGSNAGFVRELKARFGEDRQWEKDDINEDLMKVIPVNFAQDHKEMLSHLHVLVNREVIAIPKRFDMITTAMSTAIAKEYQLDKTKTSYDDSLDSLRLTAHGIKMKVQ